MEQLSENESVYGLQCLEIKSELVSDNIIIELFKRRPKIPLATLSP